MHTEPTDFVSISLKKGGTAIRSPITISTISIRDADPKLSLSFSQDEFAKLGGDRFIADWSPSTFILRLKPSPDGPFEATRSRGSRRLLRIPLPSGVSHVEGAVEPAPHRLIAAEPALFITVPPVFRSAARQDEAAARREAADRAEAEAAGLIGKRIAG